MSDFMIANTCLVKFILVVSSSVNRRYEFTSLHKCQSMPSQCFPYQLMSACIVCFFPCSCEQSYGSVKPVLSRTQRTRVGSLPCSEHTTTVLIDSYRHFQTHRRAGWCTLSQLRASQALADIAWCLAN
uniref:Uncharacterized protein n=1 Tax=Rhipicephalus zambeziensis TaxID=60191 RepID=A0A224Y6D2_9ACAR